LVNAQAEQPKLDEANEIKVAMKNLGKIAKDAHDHSKSLLELERLQAVEDDARLGNQLRNATDQNLYLTKSSLETLKQLVDTIDEKLDKLENIADLQPRGVPELITYLNNATTYLLGIWKTTQTEVRLLGTVLNKENLGKLGQQVKAVEAQWESLKQLLNAAHDQSDMMAAIAVMAATAVQEPLPSIPSFVEPKETCSHELPMFFKPKA